MAVGATGVIQIGVTTSGAATVTSSVTPQGFLVLCSSVVHGTVDFTNTTTVSGCGLTWSKLAAVAVSANHTLGELWVGYGAAPTAGAITVTYSQTPANGRLTIFDAADLASSNPGSNGTTNSGAAATSGSLTASATTGKWQVVMFSHQTAEATNPQAAPGPWKEVGDNNGGGIGLEIQVGGGNPSATASWTTSSRWLACAAEFVSAFAEPGLPDAEEVLEAGRQEASFVGANSGSDDDFGDGPKGIWGVFDGGL